MPTKLHIGNLPDSCSETTINDLFCPYGNISELVVIKNFAFVNFSEDKDAKRALNDLNGAKLLGKSIAVSISRNKGVKDKGGSSRNKGAYDKQGDNRSKQRHYCNTPLMDNTNHKSPGSIGHKPLDMTHNNLGDLGILSAVNTLAAVAQKQRSLSQMNTTGLNEHISDHFLVDMSRSSTENINLHLPNNNGYVIYERYYVDPKHPLLKGLPLPQLDKLDDIQTSLSPKFRTESFVTQEVYP